MVVHWPLVNNLILLCKSTNVVVIFYFVCQGLVPIVQNNITCYIHVCISA